ncbi:MAG: 30S ribosomal protein S15 [Elusimicrobia bacterium RIFCSPHIGHO2_02_FULL_57_9]|nr:MAG: 30S ribosomal protein S15 [Elusimicrobia bacterium RIFCSPHIGHO2_02_FULL_57_9]
MITKENRQEIVKKFSKHAGDSGNSSVQIALITERIKYLSGHLKTHKKDYASQLGLLRLVGQRRRLLAYLKKSDLKGYGDILKQLELRK